MRYASFMKVYIAHSSAYDFKKELYQPLQNACREMNHTVIFPHDGEPINSKEILSSCDLVIAEVSYPSTGLGIELGWADARGVPMICIHKADTKPSGALHFICKTFLIYHTETELVAHIREVLA